MTLRDLFESKGVLVALVVWIVGFYLFVGDTGEWMSSFAAAGMLAGLVWVSYVIIRWLVLATRKED